MSALKSLTSSHLNRTSLRCIYSKASPIQSRILLSTRSSVLSIPHSTIYRPLRSHRAFSTISKRLSPETPPTAESYASAPAQLSNEQYHELADSYLDSLVEKLEALQEENEAVDVEYSAGVLTLVLPPHGTYVLNKQPPNKQIWLSSPITGPKRYDFVLRSEGQDSKEGTGRGEWVYLRDGSTLTELLQQECGVWMER